MVQSANTAADGKVPTSMALGVADVVHGLPDADGAGPLPIDVVPFVDAGVAWTSSQSPEWSFERDSPERVPVVSSGVSARVNLFGYFVFETYYVVPFQRPNKSGYFSFQLQPGW